MTTETDNARRPRSASCVLILPRTQVIQRVFVLPTLREREVERILAYRIPLETPFLPEEIAWSWRPVQELPNGEHRIRVTIVEKERLRGYLEASEVSPHIRGLLGEDEFLALWQDHQCASEEEEVHAYRLPGRLLAVLAHEGECVRSNVQPDGGEASALMRGLLDGDGRGGTLGDRPVRVTSDLAGVAAGAELAAVPDLVNPLNAEENGLIALPAGGWLLPLRRLGDRRLAARVRSRSHRGLLPEAWRQLARGRSRLIRMLAIGVAALVLAWAGTLGIDHLVRRTRQTRVDLDSSRASLRADLEQVQAAEVLIASVEAQSDRGRGILAAWNQVSTSVPRGVRLSGLSHQDTGRILINGSAEDRELVIEFMESLRRESEDLFEGVVLGGLEKRGDRQVFHIVAHMARMEESSS